ncbi:YbaK/EbsC family protein [Ligilactobacillus pobuzihii]|uniref:YbaK prolyl-tRNA synthetase n=1 Tax=Ligilactobacillus pobuzihii TaxID=449659 RepID=A0A0R2L9S4_9LACO|nr:YbaK/EbsC family protein [Ligilactobacillus pobuzihii]KRK09345.1 YbaK prolyl-tRNA synthetase [Ligilactobacillus pobuzihii E100301 = KCTC 13174]KRN98515.1 YbaK prolyl-tRNA synthetase [Ligilactobacillus pobuzihii]GEN48541.1 aminoacyl-tRNA deacylase [Ligilactobacillus pobuzihii]
MSLATREEAITFLQKNQIPYSEIQHDAVWTAKDVVNLQGVNFPVIKNLFLKKKKSEQFFLYLLVGEKKVSFKSLAPQLQVSRSKLIFATEEELATVLGLKPGYVTPLGLIHDTDNQVTVVLDRELQEVNLIGIHPNTNMETVIIQYSDLLKMIEIMKHKVIEVDSV